MLTTVSLSIVSGALACMASVFTKTATMGYQNSNSVISSLYHILCSSLLRIDALKCADNVN